MPGGKPYRFKLPIKNNSSTPSLVVTQNDSNELIAELTHNGRPYDITGATLATYTALKPDNTVVVGPATILDCKHGEVYFELALEAVVLTGMVEITVEIYTGSKRMTSAIFTYEVTRDLAVGADPSSDSSYPILQDLVQDVSALEANVGNAEGIRVTNENARKTAEKLRDDAEKLRAYNEGLRIKYENERKVYETYNPLKTYVYGNKVNYQGSSYYCIATSQGIAPNLVPGRWVLMAEKGDKGEAANAVVTPIDGLYGLSINDTGHLILTYGTEAPAFELNSEGHLLVTI